MRIILSYKISWILPPVFLLCSVEAGKHERRLINDLFLHYNKFERPVNNESETVHLTFGVRYDKV